jgi:hypothetical protein
VAAFRPSRPSGWLSSSLKPGVLVGIDGIKHEWVVAFNISDIDRWNMGRRPAIQRHDKIIRSQSRASVGGMDAVERKYATEKVSRETITAHHDSVSIESIEKSIHVHKHSVVRRCLGCDDLIIRSGRRADLLNLGGIENLVCQQWARGSAL